MAKILRISFLAIYSISFLISSCEAKNVGRCIRDVQGSNCHQPKSSWQHDGVCLKVEGSSRLSCHVPDTRQFKLSIAVKLRQLKLAPGVKKVTELWIRGSGPGLSWEKPSALRKSADAIDKWKLDISYSYDSNALLCLDSTHCSLQQKALEFRVYRDKLGKEDMLGPNFYIPLPVSNSMEGAVGFIPPEVAVYPWFDGTSTAIKQIQVPLNTILTRKRQSTLTVNLIIPPSFDFNTRKTYPLVLIFGAPTISHILEHMYVHEASIDEAIVAAIDYTDDAPFCSLNPFNEDMTPLKFESTKVWRCKSENKQCHDCQTCWDSQRLEKCGKDEFISQAKRCLKQIDCLGAADDLLDIIELKLLTEVSKIAESRVRINFPRERLSIIGFDGAGLFACYAALTRPYTYQNSACLSAPFHWPMPSLSDAGKNGLRQGIGQVLQELNTSLLISPGLRLLHMTQKFYIDVGEKDNFFFPVIDQYQSAQWFVELLKETLWLEDSTNVHFSVIPNGGNSYYHHNKGGVEVFNRLKVPLLFFLRAEGGPNRDFPRIAKHSDTSYHKRELEFGKGISEQVPEVNDTTSESNCYTYEQSACRRWKEKESISGVPIYVLLISVGKCKTLYTKWKHCDVAYDTVKNCHA